MRKILFTFAVVAVAIIAIMGCRIHSLTAESERNASNTSALLEAVEHYRTSDSLNAVKASILTLKMAELEKHRADDLKTIETLKIKRNELEQYTALQTRTIAELQGKARDTIIIRDSVIVEHLTCIDIADAWIDLHGCIDPDDNFSGTLEVRDSLLVVETVQRKRFLGFLWKTKRVKSREIDVVSKNPYTEIVGVESIRREG
jgi:hypothetical protein